jgi:hypothetical protein
MSLWGKSTTAESRPKWLGGDGAQGASGAKEDAFATPGGWALRAGTVASGNDNASAQPEVIACVGGLSVALGSANALSIDFAAGEYADASAFSLVVTFDEAITVTSAGADGTTNNAYVVLSRFDADNMAKNNFSAAYASGTGTNKITFTAANIGTDEVGFIGLHSETITLNGTAAMVDGDGTAVTNLSLGSQSGPGGNSSILNIPKTGESSGVAMYTQAGSSSGTGFVFTGVTTT